MLRMSRALRSLTPVALVAVVSDFVFQFRLVKVSHHKFHGAFSSKVSCHFRVVFLFEYFLLNPFAMYNLPFHSIIASESITNRSSTFSSLLMTFLIISLYSSSFSISIFHSFHHSWR